MEHITFENLGISQEILQALEKKGYGYPTEIQEQAIPPLMEWKDVIAKAPTGTGKTFAFGIPVIEHIDPAQETVQAADSGSYPGAGHPDRRGAEKSAGVLRRASVWRCSMAVSGWMHRQSSWPKSRRLWWQLRAV